MKRQIYLGMAIFALAVAVFFCVLTGRQFLSLLSGPMPAADGVSLEQMEGQYITYSVAHPVASFVEEYYSGDKDRISKMAYVIYDQERQAFFKLVVSEQRKGTLNQLMQAVNRSQELKDSWGDRQASEERPVEVAGSLIPVEDPAALRQIGEALADEDSYSTDEMNELASLQTGWYVLIDKAVEGIPVPDLWLCAVAAGMSILMFLICLMLLAKKSTASAEGSLAGSAAGQLLENQRSWITSWCEKGRARQNGMAILFMAGAIAALVALGLFVGYSMQEVMTRHLPIGILVGELSAVTLAATAGTTFNPDKVLKRCRKGLERALPGQAEQDRVARELLDTPEEWSVLESGKEDIRYGIVGEHYWMVLTGKGIVSVVDADRIGKMTSETMSGQIRSGKVRMNYTYYVVQINYMDSGKKKGVDAAIHFDTEQAAGHFMTLARKRLGERAADVIK
ncbi:MAG: hypothetical protein HFG14_09200 [Lachnospiraceae bacterium]|jgi:hypothetical protein|nr:hypothetical protein [Lachnospiraceae bacterium]